jgi:hypothetical protein
MMIMWWRSDGTLRVGAVYVWYFANGEVAVVSGIVGFSTKAIS